MTTSQQDMRAEFEEWRLGGTLVSTTNPYKELTQPCQFWSFEAWQHRQQELDAARMEVERLRDLIGLSYGYLWHVNNEHGTPQRFYPPERAAYEARKLLRDTLTHEQRGQYINSVRELIDEALAAQQENSDEPLPK